MPAKDNTLYQDAAGGFSNGAGIYFFDGKTGGGLLRRGLIAFNLASIPTNATVTSATLSMFLSQTQGGSQAVSISKVSRSWGEGASDAGDPGGAGAEAAVGDATWIHTFYDTSFWVTTGGDFSPTSSATTTVNAADTTYNWSGSGLIADVQSWISDPANNFGWVVRGNEVTSGRAQRFNSRENSNNPPQLTVTYSAPCMTATPTPTPSGSPTATPAFVRPLLFPPTTSDANISIGINEACVQILDGPCTNMWTYGGTYPGMTIRRPTGQATNVTFTNNLNPATGSLSVHNHGNHSSPENDGQPDDFLIGPGGSRTYLYEGLENGGNERGTMQFYHDHRMDTTARNVWMGLTGLYIIDDPADPASLPSGSFDLPLALSDRQFDPNNQITYVFNAAGVTGDKILINGVYQPYFDVGDRKYRLRILNASNVRIYNLTLSTGDSFTQIGTESGLLPGPLARTAMRMAPAERMDVVVDFNGRFGQDIYLTDTLSNTQLLKFRVTQHLTDNSSIPATLRPLPDIGEPTVTRNFSFDRTAGHWTINGLRFDPSRVDARPVLGTTEKWVFTNPTGTTHTVHLHDVDQQCISRNGEACFPYETMKETWYLGPGETIEIKLKFTGHTGNYLFHCHMLEHEDDGMMSQFEVVAPGGTPTPTPASVSISGTVSYCSNPASDPVADVTVSLTGGTTGTTQTDASGNYLFSNLAAGGSYTVTPTKQPKAPASAGIDTVDVVAVQQHFLTISVIPAGCRRTAADVNGDSNIDTTDAFAMQRFFLGLSTGLANVGKYSFTPPNRTYLGVVSNQTGQNYDTFAFGDVTSPFADQSGLPGPRRADVLGKVEALVLPDIAVDQSRTSLIAAVVASGIDAGDQWVGFQGDFMFDERVVTFQGDPVRKAGATSGNWSVAGNVLPGAGPIRTLRVSGYSTDMQPLSGSGTLFELRMQKVNKAAPGTQWIGLESSRAFIFIDANLETQVPGHTTPGRVAPQHSSRQDGLGTGISKKRTRLSKL